MCRSKLICVLALLFLVQLVARADDPTSLPKCSTEKINRHDCVVFVDREFPITSPTFSMYPGSHIRVVLFNAFHFETVSLDPGTAQTFESTDQIAGLVTAAIPNFKGFVGGTSTYGYASSVAKAWSFSAKTKDIHASDAQNKLDTLRGYLKTAAENASKQVQKPIEDIFVVYAQLKEIQMATPRPVRRHSDEERRSQGVPRWTPKPWPFDAADVPPAKQFERWRAFLLYELNGDAYDLSDPGLAPVPPDDAPTDVIGQITAIQLILPIPPADSSHTATCPAGYIFDSSTFDAYVPTVRAAVRAVNDAGDQKIYQAQLDKLIAEKARINDALLADTLNFTKVKTDLQSYYWNISQWSGDTGQTGIQETTDKKGDNPLELGRIPDPVTKTSKLSAYVAPYEALGRQTTYTINVVNQIGTPGLSVATSSQKTPVATITAIYADPHFEVSSGAFFSSMANRSFANVTTETITSNGTPVPVDIRLVKTTTHPEVLPFVAGNYRLGPEAIWPDQRRYATYFTLAVALNPYNTLPEFAGGLSFSWRFLMLSPLYHLGHSTHLTQGLKNGQIYCVYGAPSTSDPGPCTSAPPAPTTTTYWTNGYALGLSVRIPTVFNSTNH